MPDELKIARVQLTGARRAEQAIRVEVINSSETTTLHVWADDVFLAFEPKPGVLTADVRPVYDPEIAPDHELLTHHFHKPRSLALAPGARHEFVVPIPPVIRQAIVRSSGIGLDVKETAVTSIRRVTVRVGYADIPFLPVLGSTLPEATAEMARLASVVKRSNSVRSRAKHTKEED